MIGALRRKFVREAVADVLRQCRGHRLLETTLMQQVNLTLAPLAAPLEIRNALQELRDKGRAEWSTDPDDIELKLWRTTE